MKVAFQESIVYYDCELLFEAVDQDGQGYIAVHGECKTAYCEYDVVPATQENLTAFKAGRIGLNELLRAAPAGEWYNTEPGGTPENITLVLRTEPLPADLRDTDTDYYVPQ